MHDLTHRSRQITKVGRLRLEPPARIAAQDRVARPSVSSVLYTFVTEPEA
jgi:hypothetical protein